MSEWPDNNFNSAIPFNSANPPAQGMNGDASAGVSGVRSIGNYVLLKKLGEGGMGQVWLAEQTSPVRRQVALKLIRAGMCDSTILHRFQSERQSLAIMDHPAIAKVFDAGATPDGQPYFVMEYVPGLPITDYCDQKKLNIRERLALFIQVCDGVQHAHQKSIMHRDLKPANVLVVEVDGKPMPRIIDFGLAKAAIQSDPRAANLTMAGMPLGTPSYMSPEQADPEVLDVDTRTDVYSLGVLLYELLTGALPFDPDQWENKPLSFVLKQLREGNVPRPSTQLKKKTSAHSGAATEAADARGTDSARLVKLLRGDLDWITMKALEKDRARRYGTPSELAADVSRYLSNEAVVAGPATAAYRVRKYAVRHRIALGVAAALALLLGGFVIIQGIELRRITHERDRATRVTDFMTGIFKVSKPSEAKGNIVTAREILDQASTEIDSGLTKDPELQAQMMSVMGDVYDNLGLYSRALALQQKTVEIRERVLGKENPETLRAMSDLAETLRLQGKFADAETLERKTIDAQKRVLGVKNADSLTSMHRLARIFWGKGRYPEAEKLDRETLQMRTEVLGAEHPDTVSSMGSLARDLRSEHHQDDVVKIYRAVLDIRRRVLGPEHPDTLTSMSDLGNVLTDVGSYDEAKDLHLAALEIRRRVLGPEHPQTLQTMNNLADTYIRRNEYPEAEQVAQQALEIQRRVLGPQDPDRALSAYNLACIESHRDKKDEAISLLQEALDHGLPPYAELFMAKDLDLKSLFGDQRFIAISAHAQELAAAAKKTN